jgi:hypothetical protein
LTDRFHSVILFPGVGRRGNTNERIALGLGAFYFFERTTAHCPTLPNMPRATLSGEHAALRLKKESR